MLIGRIRECEFGPQGLWRTHEDMSNQKIFEQKNTYGISGEGVVPSLVLQSPQKYRELEVAHLDLELVGVGLLQHQREVHNGLPFPEGEHRAQVVPAVGRKVPDFVAVVAEHKGLKVHNLREAELPERRVLG